VPTLNCFPMRTSNVPGFVTIDSTTLCKLLHTAKEGRQQIKLDEAGKKKIWKRYFKINTRQFKEFYFIIKTDSAGFVVNSSEFEVKQYLEEHKGAEALYSDNVNLTTLCEWIQDACLRTGRRDNRELKKQAKEQKQSLDTDGSMLMHETLEDLYHRCKSMQVSYNAAYTKDSEKLTDKDMVDIMQNALDPERYGEYKVHLYSPYLYLEYEEGQKRMPQLNKLRGSTT
jgi:hypothetical protein